MRDFILQAHLTLAIFGKFCLWTISNNKIAREVDWITHDQRFHFPFYAFSLASKTFSRLFANSKLSFGGKSKISFVESFFEARENACCKVKEDAKALVVR